MSEFCVCCGAEIPEGRMVCPNCETKPDKEQEKENKVKYGRI